MQHGKENEGRHEGRHKPACLGAPEVSVHHMTAYTDLYNAEAQMQFQIGSKC